MICKGELSIWGGAGKCYGHAGQGSTSVDWERDRLKNKGDVTYPSKGEVILIKSEEKNWAQWKLGIVEDLITSCNGVIGGAQLKAKVTSGTPNSASVSTWDKLWQLSTDPNRDPECTHQSTGREGMLQRQIDFVSRIQTAMNNAYIDDHVWPCTGKSTLALIC